MAGHAVRVQVGCRGDEQDVLLLAPSERAFLAQNGTDQVRLRLHDVGSQCLGQEEIRYIAVGFAERHERRERVFVEIDLREEAHRSSFRPWACWPKAASRIFAIILVDASAGNWNERLSVTIVT